MAYLPALASEAGEVPDTRADCEIEERGDNSSELGIATIVVGEPAKTIA